MKKMVFGLCMCFAVMAFANIADGDFVVPNQTASKQTIELPPDFDVQAATAEMKAARKSGNRELAAEIHLQINAWWQQNRIYDLEAPEHGDGTGRKIQEPNEEHSTVQQVAPLWGNDVQIDPRANIKPARVAALSNGELYAFAVHDDGSSYWAVIRRSTDDGATWSTYWNAQFATTTVIFDPGIMVVNDTLVYWYILDHPASNEMRTWVKVCLPGTSDTPIYYGSPTGLFNPYDYSDLTLTTDAANYPSDEYLYATWTEWYGTGPDSTKTMAAVSQEIDVGAWEVGPTQLRSTTGANIYYSGTRIAWGSDINDMLWQVAYLQPADWPVTYDRAVRGMWSDNYGSTWTGPVDITPLDNDRDEFDPTIAGGHTNTNWAVLATECDTNYSSDLDVVNWYSTDDGSNWIDSDAWMTNSYENYLPDVFVDVNSTGFYGVCRQDRTTDEDVRYKFSPINDPNNWSESTSIVDDPSLDLSGVYGPCAGYNPGNGDAICAWTSYHASEYGIWFSSASWTGTEELQDNRTAMGMVSLAPNPSHGLARLSFVVMNEGPVTVSVYDATGRLVNNLLNETRPAGEYSLTIANENLAAGVYFVQVETPEGITGKTMTIIR